MDEKIGFEKFLFNDDAVFAAIIAPKWYSQ
jgi:hypothetical protein